MWNNIRFGKDCMYIIFENIHVFSSLLFLSVYYLTEHQNSLTSILLIIIFHLRTKKHSIQRRYIISPHFYKNYKYNKAMVLKIVHGDLVSGYKEVQDLCFQNINGTPEKCQRASQNFINKMKDILQNAFGTRTLKNIKLQEMITYWENIVIKAVTPLKEKLCKNSDNFCKFRMQLTDEKFHPLQKNSVIVDQYPSLKLRNVESDSMKFILESAGKVLVGAAWSKVISETKNVNHPEIPLLEYHYGLSDLVEDNIGIVSNKTTNKLIQEDLLLLDPIWTP